MSRRRSAKVEPASLPARKSPEWLDARGHLPDTAAGVTLKGRSVPRPERLPAIANWGATAVYLCPIACR
jgi:hypothetical protein